MSTAGVTFQSKNGNKLVGRLWLAKGENPRPTVLLLHGLPGIDQNHDLAYALKNAGWNCLIFHYQGSWGSEGGYSLHHVLSDIDQALEFLTTHPDVDRDNIVVCGHSLGGWAAVMTGARHSAVKAVISIAGVSDWSMMNLNEEFATGTTLFLVGIQPARLIQESTELEHAVDMVEQLNGRPLLAVHGTKDPGVPLAHSEALLERYSTNSTLHVIDGADHGFSWQRDELIGTVLGWLKRLV
ncbi:MAG: alpha/beta hydrolase family protein [Anaerolineae bacterium]